MPENQEPVNEISLSDVFSRLWAGRGIIVALPILTAALAALYVGMLTLSQNRPATYLVNLRNIENQSYPNGAAFSPQDLLIPEVLGALRERFKIPATASLREAITITYDSPVANGIARNYQERLAVRNLTQAEIEALNQSYLRELQAAMRSSLRINVDYNLIGVDSATGLQIAAVLPQLWTQIYTTKFRIFTDRRLSDLAVTKTDEDLSTSASILVVNARLDSMRDGLSIFMTDNRLSLLQTADGISPADLDVGLRRFTTTWFNPIKASRLQSGDTVANSYLADLKLDIAERRRRVDAYDQTLSELKEYQGLGRIPPQVGGPQPPQGDRNGAVQIGDTALTEIVQLAEQASFAAFIQDTLRDRHKLLTEISHLTRELELSLNEAENVSTSSEFREQAAASLQELSRNYSELVAAAQSQLRDRGGDLYEPALGPLISGSLFSTQNLLVVGVAGFAGGVFAVLFVFLWASVRRRATEA